MAENFIFRKFKGKIRMLSTHISVENVQLSVGTWQHHVPRTFFILRRRCSAGSVCLIIYKLSTWICIQVHR